MDKQTQRILDIIKSDSFHCVSEGKDAIDSVLSVINFIFDDSTQNQHVDLALDIIDRSKGTIQCVRGSSSHQRIYKIVSSKETPYHCLLNYCPCRHYFELNKSSPDYILCKHLLAIRFAMALHCIEEVVLDNQEYFNIVADIIKDH